MCTRVKGVILWGVISEYDVNKKHKEVPLFTKYYFISILNFMKCLFVYKKVRHIWYNMFGINVRYSIGRFSFRNKKTEIITKS